jgi:uncharacterized membrane protein
MEEFNDPIINSKNYKWGIFYFNKSDSRVFVPKRYGKGYTVNFSNPYVWAGFVLILLFILYKIVLS